MTPGARNALVLVVTAVVVGLLRLLPTSTNQPVHQKTPAAPSGVMTPTP